MLSQLIAIQMNTWCGCVLNAWHLFSEEMATMEREVHGLARVNERCAGLVSRAATRSCRHPQGRREHSSRRGNRRKAKADSRRLPQRGGRSESMRVAERQDRALPRRHRFGADQGCSLSSARCPACGPASLLAAASFCTHPVPILDV